MPVTIELRLISGRFCSGEDIPVGLEMRNTGPVTVQVPDGTYLANRTPLYFLSGPEYPAGVTFNLSGLVERPRDIDPATSPAVPMTIQPGGVKLIQFGLTGVMPLARPGFYDLTAQVACQGAMLRSEPARFELIEPTAFAGSFGRQDGARSADELWSSWLLRSRRGGAIVRRVHYLSEDGDTMVTGATRRIAEAGPLCPAPVSARVPRGVRDRRWIVYFEGSKVFAHADGLEQPILLERPGTVTAIVPSPVTLGSGALEAFLLEEDTLTLVRFYPPEGSVEVEEPDAVEPSGEQDAEDAEGTEAEDEEEDEEDEQVRIPSPEARCSLEIQKGPQAVAALHCGPEQGCRIVCLYESRGGVIVRHLVLDEIRKSVAEGTAFLPDVLLIPDSTPGLRVEENGMSHVAVLLWKRDPANSAAGESVAICLADLRFDSSGIVCIAPGTSMATVCSADAEPVAAALDWFGANGRSRQDWVVLLKNGSMLRNSAGGPVLYRNPFPVVPMQLLSLEHVTCLAVREPGGGPEIRFV